MAFHTFLASLAYDEASRRGIAGTVGKVVDHETQVPVDVFDMDGNPTVLVSNASGFVGQFKTDSAHDLVDITFGNLSLTKTAEEVIKGASLALAELDRLSISNLGIDTDGTPYFSIGNTAAHMHQDVDGTPYYTPA